MANNYADSRACAACHQKIAETYSQTGMGRSLYKPSPANTVENYRNHNEFTHAASGTHYAMIARDGNYFQRRWQTGFDGKETNVEELRIDYVIGSGNHARSYLHRTATGGYIELPLSWYPRNGGTWEMSPGFDNAHPQTRRYASYECIFCHDAYPKIPPGNEAPGSDPIFAADLPQGIDCQRCHGPGGDHVRNPTAGNILNPAHLPAALQMDVCRQCHQEPTSGALPALIRRFDRGPFSFAPGEPLSNFALFFDHAPNKGYDDKFEIVNSSAYRLAKSQCFLKSSGAMTCSTCHDPHSTQTIAHYSDVCQRCHATARLSAQHLAAQECITCHMPKRQTDDVVHAVMTDHWIRRVPQPHQAPPKQDYRGEVIPYDSQPPPLYRAAAQVLLQNNVPRGLPELSRLIATNKSIDPEFYMVLGQAWLNSGKGQEAAAVFQKAPESTRSLLALATAWNLAGKPEKAREALSRAIQKSPLNAAARYQLGMLDLTSNRFAEAIQQFRNAIALDPDFAAASSALGEALFRTGNIPAAHETVLAALRINPYDASAYDLSGRILATEDKVTESLFDFEKATQVRPGFAPYLYDYALELFAAHRNQDSQTSVRAALAADPAMPEAHALLGNLLAAEGNRTAAIQELKIAATATNPQVAAAAKQALQNLLGN